MKALKFATEAHKDQRRKDVEYTPYINHPIEVARILTEVNVINEDIIAAAFLHDVIEDTEYTYNGIVEVFGKPIADIVLECTDDKSLPKEDRKRLQIEHALLISNEAKLIKIADKIANMEDIIHNPPAEWDVNRKLKYFEWAKQVVDNARGINKDLDDWFDTVYELKVFIK